MKFSRPVYPRWRGEHRIVKPRYNQECGLSPLARGTPGRCRLPCGTKRFIPAGAGNTFSCLTTDRRLTVYPRWRGEHAPLLSVVISSPGLSPLARGTQQITGEIHRHDRFIPAGAGNTTSTPVSSSISPVYPRWRGEHTKDILLFYNSFLSTQQFTNFITTISHY